MAGDMRVRTCKYYFMSRMSYEEDYIILCNKKTHVTTIGIIVFFAIYLNSSNISEKIAIPRFTIVRAISIRNDYHGRDNKTDIYFIALAIIVCFHKVSGACDL